MTVPFCPPPPRETGRPPLGWLLCSAVSQVIYTEDDNGREIQLHTGDLVNVALPENPTTGHLWQIASVSSEGLLPQAVHFSPGDATAPGSAGTRTFTFRTQAPGRATLELHLRRPWQAAAPPPDVSRLCCT
ncbi:protease inhibitor I42 family protein [Streptomyces sp. BH105]|uniref:protease inhibitor I42 family protein n=1 Tax=Streptomyces sp. BH105 TaxID=3410408 RepID=UPI003CED2BEE